VRSCPIVTGQRSPCPRSQQAAGDVVQVRLRRSAAARHLALRATRTVLRASPNEYRTLEGAGWMPARGTRPRAASCSAKPSRWFSRAVASGNGAPRSRRWLAAPPRARSPAAMSGRRRSPPSARGFRGWCRAGRRARLLRRRRRRPASGRVGSGRLRVGALPGSRGRIRAATCPATKSSTATFVRAGSTK
jgi:hypothetical protein